MRNQSRGRKRNLGRARKAEFKSVGRARFQVRVSPITTVMSDRQELIRNAVTFLADPKVPLSALFGLAIETHYFIEIDTGITACPTDSVLRG